MDGTKKSGVKLTWVPAKKVEHHRYSDLVAIRGHKNFYGNLLSGKITYRLGSVKIPTGETSIMKAREYVEIKLRMRQGESDLEIKKNMKGELGHLFPDAWDEFLKFKLAGKKINTAKTYKKNFNTCFKPFFEHTIVSNINYSTILGFKKWYLDNHPTRHFKKTGIHLNAFLKFCHKKNYINSVPDLSELKEIDKITAKNNRKEWSSNSKTFTDDEVKLLITTSNSIFQNPELNLELKLGLLLAVRCGLRIMEALTLRWGTVGKINHSYVDLKKNEINIWSEKNYKWRKIPMPKEVRQCFLEHKVYAKSDWVFPAKKDLSKHTYAQVFDNKWVKLKKVTGITGRFHDLRHTFATKTAELGWPPVVACEILDQSLKVYQKTYCKPSIESKKSLMDEDMYE